MKVVNIITQMEAGGAQQVAMNIAAVLHDRGYDAEVWFLYMKRPTYQKYKGVRVVLDRKPAFVWDYIFIFWGLVLLFYKYKPKVVITHTYYANIMGQIAACLFFIPARLAVQHNPVNTYPKTAKILDFIMGTSGIYKHNIAVSKAAFNSFASYPGIYRKRLMIIYNGIPAPVPKLNKEKARYKFGLPIKGVLILNVGRLAGQKNQILLIQILKELPDVYLAIAGEGDLRKTLEDEASSLGISNRFFLFGEIPPQEIADFLVAGDIFVFPSLFEALPFALVEAMAVGLPVVASDIPSLREVLEGPGGELAGLLVELMDLDNFCLSIKKIVEDSVLANQLSNLSRERSKEFNLERMVDLYEQQFLKYMNKAG